MKPLFPPHSDWKPPTTLPDWGAKRIGIDVETCDPQIRKLGPGVRRGGYVVGISIALEDGPAFYLPIGHSEGNMDREQVLRYLRSQASKFTGIAVGANLQYDLDYLAGIGVEFPLASFRDVQIAEPLLDEYQDRYGLEAIAQRYNMPGKDERLLDLAAETFALHPKKELYLLPAKYVGAYAEQDVRLPLELLRRQERRIDDENLWGIYELECQLLPHLVRMRRHGVRIDLKKLQEISDWSEAQEREKLSEVKHLTGCEVTEVWNAEQMAAPLRAIGIKLHDNANGLPSVTAAVLDNAEHPVTDALRWARKMSKLRNTFVQLLLDHRIGDRIHCTFNQLRRERDDDSTGGTVSGRLSSENPNMQFQPGRDPDIGPLWRSVYVPDEGMQWASLDYSLQEPRLVVHYATLEGLPKAEAVAERYRSDPATDHHQMMADMIHGRTATKDERKAAKEIFLGLCYGMGGAKLCRKLGLSTVWWKPGTSEVYPTREEGTVEVAGEEGKLLLGKFDAEVPFVRKLAKKVAAKAQKKGYIRTVLGRRCRFPKLADGTHDWTHKALNRLIQGSAADQTKKALLEVAKAGMLVQLQIHDEITLSVRDREEAEVAARIMLECVPLQVPSKVDIEMGSSWGDSMKKG